MNGGEPNEKNKSHLKRREGQNMQTLWTISMCIRRPNGNWMFLKHAFSWAHEAYKIDNEHWTKEKKRRKKEQFYYGI